MRLCGKLCDRFIFTFYTFFNIRRRKSLCCNIIRGIDILVSQRYTEIRRKALLFDFSHEE